MLTLLHYYVARIEGITIALISFLSCNIELRSVSNLRGSKNTLSIVERGCFARGNLRVGGFVDIGDIVGVRKETLIVIHDVKRGFNHRSLLKLSFRRHHDKLLLVLVELGPCFVVERL